MIDLTKKLWRHKKTGGLYRIVMACRIKAQNEPAYAYRSEETGIVWVSPADEFLDGRFEEVEDEAVKRAQAIEVKAREIYEGWSDQRGYVPWAVGGNSIKQDDARREARAALKQD